MLCRSVGLAVLAAVVGVAVVAGAAAALLYRPTTPMPSTRKLVPHDRASDPRPARIKTKMRTVIYGGVALRVPAPWARLDTRRCPGPSAAWGPEGSRPCNPVEAVMLFGSATYDPAYGPGDLHQHTENGAVMWGGFQYVGKEYAVYASTRDPDLARSVLASSRTRASN